MPLTSSCLLYVCQCDVSYFVLFSGSKKKRIYFPSGEKTPRVVYVSGGGGLKPETLWNYTKVIYNRLVKSKQKHLDRES